VPPLEPAGRPGDCWDHRRGP